MRLRTVTISSLVIAAVAVLPSLTGGFATVAGAAPGVTGQARLYWAQTSSSNNGIFWRNLDGSGSATKLVTTGATDTDAGGMTLDPRNGYVYWTNCGSQLTLSRAKLDGSGGADLRHTTAGGCPWGVAIDHAAQKVYYVDWTAGGLYRTEMDGTNQVTITPTGGSSISRPSDIIIDPTQGYLYWSNDSPARVGRVALSNYAGTDLSTSPITPGSVNALFLNRTAGKIYWTDFGHASAGAAVIGVANMDGSGSGQNITPGSPWPYANPQGIAADVANNKIYFSSGSKITAMSMTGTGATDIQNSSGHWVYFMAILAPPVNTAAPAVTGTATVGSTLTCGNGSWEMDRQEERYFDAPTSYSYTWTRNGSATGDTGAAVTASAGVYACLVTATNAAGTNTVVSSNSVTVTEATTTTAPAVTTSVSPATTTTAPAVTTSVSPATTAPALVVNVNAPTTTYAVIPSPTSTIRPAKVSVPATTAPATRSSAATSTTTSTVPVVATTTTLPAPVPAAVVNGEAAMTVGGKSITPTVERRSNKLVITAGDYTASLASVDKDGNITPLDADGNVKLSTGQRVQVNASGFEPDSTVEIWLFSTPTKLGEMSVDETGKVSGTFVIPEGTPAGSHRMVILARGKNAEDTTLTVGMTVGEWKKSKNIATWLIVLPIVLAVIGALTLPATRRRKRRMSSAS